MLRSISVQLILVFTLVVVSGIGTTAYFAGRLWNEAAEQERIENYRTDFIEMATCYYRLEGSLVGIDRIYPGPNQGKNNHVCTRLRALKGRPPIDLTLVDLGMVVRAHIGGPHHLREQLPSPVVTLGQQIFDDEGHHFATVISQSSPVIGRALLYTSGGAILIILLIGTFWVRKITHPLQKLTTATQAIAAGDLDHQVTINSNNELGQLATAFNQMSADLVRANQLRRRMTADIAHELRNPLAVLTMDIEGLHDGILKPTTSVLNRMQDEVQNLNRLVGDLRTLSLVDANELRLHREPTAPQDLLDKLALLFEFQARQKGITLTVNSAPNLPTLNIDPERITQVFINLVSNALRYTPMGGAITLTAEQADQAVQFTVIDNGAGIAADKLPHIFDRFYRADSAREPDQGESGLGLAIVKSLVEAHDGTVSVESKAGQGTKFVIVLPLDSTPE